MTATHATVPDHGALRRFVESVHDLSDHPSAPNVSRYLRASADLDRSAPKPRPAARAPRSENAPKRAA